MAAIFLLLLFLYIPVFVCVFELHIQAFYLLQNCIYLKTRNFPLSTALCPVHSNT